MVFDDNGSASDEEGGAGSDEEGVVLFCSDGCTVCSSSVIAVSSFISAFPSSLAAGAAAVSPKVSGMLSVVSLASAPTPGSAALLALLAGTAVSTEPKYSLISFIASSSGCPLFLKLSLIRILPPLYPSCASVFCRSANVSKFRPIRCRHGCSYSNLPAPPLPLDVTPRWVRFSFLDGEPATASSYFRKTSHKLVLLGNLSLSLPPPSPSGSCNATDTTPGDLLARVNCNFAPPDRPDSRKGCDRSTVLLFCVLSIYPSGLSLRLWQASSSTSRKYFPGVTLICVRLKEESTTNTLDAILLSASS